MSATNCAKSLPKGMQACQHKAMTSHNTSSLRKMKVPLFFLRYTVFEIIAYECEAYLEMLTRISPKPSRPVHSVTWRRDPKRIYRGEILRAWELGNVHPRFQICSLPYGHDGNWTRLPSCVISTPEARSWYLRLTFSLVIKPVVVLSYLWLASTHGDHFMKKMKLTFKNYFFRKII